MSKDFTDLVKGESEKGLNNLKGLTQEAVEKMDDDELENIGKKKKKKTKRRKLEGKLKLLITSITVLMSLYHLYTAINSVNPLQQRAIHLLFVLTLVFLLYPASSKAPTKRPSIGDYGFILLSIFAIGHILIRITPIIRAGGRCSNIDLMFGGLAVLVVIEAARRAVGNALPIMAIILIAYAFLGRYVPGPLMHSGFSVKRVITFLTMTTEGIYGQILGVSSTYIFLFILFGAFLSVSGMSKVFNDIALAIAGASRGGPAKVSIMASGLMGTISGSTSANVVTTGTFTIPVMKGIGYQNYFAGAVETAASAGGQIMPPIMGSAAFLIADALGVPYASVLRAAILPALLYYFSIWTIVDLRARSRGIKGLKKEDLPILKEIIFKRGHLLIPLFGIIYMLVAGYNAIYAALVGIALSVASSFLKRETWIKPKDLIKALETGALAALSVASACAIIGIIIGIVSLSGAVLTLGNAILKLSGGLLLPTLILTTMVSIVMGMGLPTSACYILTSTIAAPALTKMGVMPMQAHLFVFYYGILSTITPPVATGAYAAAGIAGSDPAKTGWTGLRLASAGFIIPYMFIFSPELLLPAGLDTITLIRVVITSIIGILALGWCVEGYYRRPLNLIERLISGAGAISLINSSLITDIVGFGCVAIVSTINIIYSKRSIKKTA